MKKRYKLIRPVPGGYAYWDVIDLQSPIMPNFAVASLSKHGPNARRNAVLLMHRLNAGN